MCWAWLRMLADRYSSKVIRRHLRTSRSRLTIIKRPFPQDHLLWRKCILHSWDEVRSLPSLYRGGIENWYRSCRWTKVTTKTSLLELLFEQQRVQRQAPPALQTKLLPMAVLVTCSHPQKSQFSPPFRLLLPATPWHGATSRRESS